MKDSPISLKSPVGDLVSSVSGITGQINGIIGNAADILAERLGIHQWYGWHLRNFCEGMYKPSALDPSARLDVEKCSNPSSACKIFTNCANFILDNLILYSSIQNR